MEISILCVLQGNYIMELINLSPSAGALRLDQSCALELSSAVIMKFN